MKKILNLIGMLLIVVFFCSTFGSAESYYWKIQHPRPIGTPVDEDVNWLVNQLKERSEGRINITIFPAGQLGSYELVQERVGIGEIEMNFANGLDTSRDKGLQVQVLPYIVNSWEEAKEYFSSDSITMSIVAELLKKQNIKLISVWPSFFGGIILKKLPNKPEDPNVPKNVKIRIPSTKVDELSALSLGYQVTPLAWSEVYTALQTGIVDGLIGSGAEGCYSMFRDVANYYVAINDHFENWFFYMNLDLWNSLSKEDKQLIQEVGSELEEKRFSVAKEEEQYYFQLIKDSGIEIITFTDDILNKIAAKVREDVWTQVREDIGPELIDQILNEINNP